MQNIRSANKYSRYLKWTKGLFSILLVLTEFRAKKLGAACELLSRGPKSGLEVIEPKLESFVQELSKVIFENEGKGLSALAHPLLKSRSEMADNLRVALIKRYKKPWESSVFRTFGFSSAHPSSRMEECEGGLYSIPLRFNEAKQWGLWWQLRGLNELGRIYVQILPYEQGFKVGALQVMQWTLGQKDYEVFYQEAKEALRNKDVNLAYLKLEFAEKLLAGSGKVLIFQHQAEIKAKRLELYSPAQWLSYWQKTWQLPRLWQFTGTFIEEGAGLLIREGLAKEEPLEGLRKLCEARALKLEPFKRDFLGLHCSFVLPEEASTRDGIMGSIYVDFKDPPKK